MRERRTSIAIGRITRIDHDTPHPCYRAETLNPFDPTEHVLLRDSDTLELAFALDIDHANPIAPTTLAGPTDEDIASNRVQRQGFPEQQARVTVAAP